MVVEVGDLGTGGGHSQVHMRVRTIDVKRVDAHAHESGCTWMYRKWMHMRVRTMDVKRVRMAGCWGAIERGHTTQ